jgi:hypothetical protein
MRKKVMILLLVVAICGGGSLAAEIPSIFEVGLMNTYTLQDIADTDYVTYTPGVRMAFFITEWFGLSGEAALVKPFEEGSTGTQLRLATNLIARWPLGFFETYAALGPVYDMTVNSGAIDLATMVLYHARIGFDFNITPVFAIALEATHVVNLNEVVSGTPIDLMGDTSAGIVLKMKL